MDAVDRLWACGVVRDVDRYFARLMGELADRDSPGLRLGACLVSARTGEADICIPLSRYAGQVLSDEPEPVIAPGLDEWCEALRASGVVGLPGAAAPLVLDDARRLYLGRYWYLEALLARGLLSRALGNDGTLSPVPTRDVLGRLFPGVGDRLEGQRLAAALALLRRLVIVSGGPGTGKTRTVTRILGLLAECGGDALRIGLAAPTGKAAARLAESVKAEKRVMDAPVEVLALIPDQATTLHRLLGFIPGRSTCRHGAGNPLPLDVLVVDEASMVDLPLMARLVDALAGDARLILLGDKDQLASVEAGAVLADVCGSDPGRAYTRALGDELERVCGARPEICQESVPGIADSIVLLRQSYRFSQDSGIGALANAINDGDADGMLAVLRDESRADVAWMPRSRELASQVGQLSVARFAACLRADDSRQVLARYGRFRILCALREGPFGVARINALVEGALRRAGLIRSVDRWYPGRPIMITRNDHQLGLYNGDVGVALPDPEAGHGLRVFFETPDGSFRPVLPARLPAHETAYAMTVHKSQGSEFDQVSLILPDRPAPVLTRELVYTAVTRARERVQIWSPEHVLVEAISRVVARSSGLRDAIWGRPGTPDSQP